MALITAKRYAARIEDVAIDGLLRAGVRLVLVDRDNTCVPRDSKKAPHSVTSSPMRSSPLRTRCFWRFGATGSPGASA